jgi:hypothetical protein
MVVVFVGEKGEVWRVLDLLGSKDRNMQMRLPIGVSIHAQEVKQEARYEMRRKREEREKKVQRGPLK